MTKFDGVVERRAMLLAGGAVATTAVLSGCIVEQTAPEPATTRPAPTDAAATPTEQGTAGPPEGQQPLAQVVDVPAGGGLVLKDQKVVLTRDLEGRVSAFSAVCTHQGCLVSTVQNGTIDCACHGSKFDLTTGERVAGPAKKPLPPVSVQRRDGAIFQA